MYCYATIRLLQCGQDKDLCWQVSPSSLTRVSIVTCECLGQCLSECPCAFAGAWELWLRQGLTLCVVSSCAVMYFILSELCSVSFYLLYGGLLSIECVHAAPVISFWRALLPDLRLARCLRVMTAPRANIVCCLFVCRANKNNSTSRPPVVSAS